MPGIFSIIPRHHYFLALDHHLSSVLVFHVDRFPQSDSRFFYVRVTAAFAREKRGCMDVLGGVEIIMSYSTVD